MVWAFSAVDHRFGVDLYTCRQTVDRYKISGISRLMAEISEVKHGPSHIANRGHELFRNFDLDLLELLKSDFV